VYIVFKNIFLMGSFRKILRTLLSANIIFCLVIILHSCKDYDDSYGAIPTFDPLVNNITQTEADISGIVFRATSVYLEYGVDTTYGNTISCGTFTFRYESNVGHSHLTNLYPNTTYHCRGVAKNKHRTNYSPDLTFTTLP
jgi:hypothetical protein